MVKERKNKEKEIQQLIEAVTSLKDEKESALFLRDLLSPQELDTIATRFDIARRLYETDESYRKISKETGVSTTTITRTYNWIARGEGGLMDMLKKMFGKPTKEICDNREKLSEKVTKEKNHHHKTKA